MVAQPPLAETTMTQAARSFIAPEAPDDFSRLRRHAAVVRALLDELERVLPSSGASARSDAAFRIHEQLVEELGRVGCRLLECAASLTEVVFQVPVAGHA
jgi:hypothetical protein